MLFSRGDRLDDCEAATPGAQFVAAQRISDATSCHVHGVCDDRSCQDDIGRRKRSPLQAWTMHDHGMNISWDLFSFVDRIHLGYYCIRSAHFSFCEENVGTSVFFPRLLRMV